MKMTENSITTYGVPSLPEGVIKGKWDEIEDVLSKIQLQP